MKSAVPIITQAALLLSGASHTHGKDFAYADHVPFLSLEQHGQMVKTTVFAVQTPKDATRTSWVSLGTGFFFRTTNNVVLGITCKHVVLPLVKQKKPLFIGIDTAKGYRRFPCNILHINPKHDVAVVAPQKSSNENIEIRNITLGDELFGDAEDLVEGRGILMPGYPLALGTEDDKNHPVLRHGIVAQHTGKNHFLIDGVASHGNSGSPVYTLKYKDRRLVGMVTSHVTDSITLLDENGNMTARLPYNSGLARAITIEVIKDILAGMK